MIQIKRASELTGIPEATLRIWERRYGLGATHRSNSGYRLYDQGDLLVIQEMQRLIENGFSPNEAAKEAKAKHLAYGEVTDANILTEQFFTAMENLDSKLLSQVLDEIFSKSSFEHVIDNWLAPTLQELGLRWQRGEVNIASEHFASHAIMRRLSAAFESAGQSQTGPKIIIGAPSGSSHEMGTLAFATAVRRRGIPVIYLGIEVPPKSWAEAVVKYGADAVVISVKREADLSITHDCISELRQHCPEVKIIVGSSFAGKIEGADLALDGSIVSSVDMLSELLLA